MKTNAPMVRLGDYIEFCEERNCENSFSAEDVRGVSNLKGFIPTKANIDGRSLLKFSLIRPLYFAFNRRTTRNGERLGLGFNDTDKTYICTEDYVVFKVKQEYKDILLPNFLNLIFMRDEFDRYVRWDSWGSATEFFNWENMCRVTFPLPSIDTQRELVAIYDGLKKIVAENEALIKPLEKACRAFLVDLEQKYPLHPLAGYIEECYKRNDNKSLVLDDVRGISIEKKFIATKANMDGVSLTSYKVVEQGWFCYVPVTSRNGGKLSIALCQEKTSIIVSSFYTVFRSKNENVLLPEYLFLLFNRPEFDRYARFNSWGSAREIFDFSEMCRVEIPVPPIEIQRSIAAVAHCLGQAKQTIEKTSELMKNLCPALVQKAAHSA